MLSDRIVNCSDYVNTVDQEMSVFTILKKEVFIYFKDCRSKTQKVDLGLRKKIAIVRMK